jgi:hypothetical protein
MVQGRPFWCEEGDEVVADLFAWFVDIHLNLRLLLHHPCLGCLSVRLGQFF